MNNQQNPGYPITQGLTRRQLIKAGGIAAVGLAFTKPLIDTIYPKPAFAAYEPTPPDEPPGGGTGGCTPGFWKQEQHFGHWIPAGWAPGEFLKDMFASVDNGSYPGISGVSLLAALNFPDHEEPNPVENLLRHGVAAVLNADHPDVNYPRTSELVRSLVNDALLDAGDFGAMNALKGDENTPGTLDGDNNLGCSFGVLFAE